MGSPARSALYAPAHTRAAYQLRWSLSLFWRECAVEDGAWLAPLRAATEPDGVRILEHRVRHGSTSQFLLSTKPGLSPAGIVRSLKGRLQHLIRADQPKAFSRNYSITSVGDADKGTVERYVSAQLDHHRMADPRVQDRLGAHQFEDPDIDLASVQRTAHGEYVFGLHVVLVHADRWMEVRPRVLRLLSEAVLATSDAQGHRLSRVGVFPDHVHLVLGCNISDCPEAVALTYMNDLGWAQDGKPVYMPSYYAGTIGPYDMGAVRRNL